MCGRYYIDSKMQEKVEEMTGEKEESILYTQNKIEIYPSAQAPILIKEKGEWKEKWQTWGFEGFQKGRVIFNARSETALEKKMFQESMKERRCIIPAKYFYEWDSKKNKFTFYREDEDILFLAGFYKQNRFVILTTQANESMKEIHDRMPLILERTELESWISGEKIEDILKNVPVMLNKMF